MKKSSGIYDQIFNFLFDIQVSKKVTNIRRNKNFGDFGNSLLELGTQPAIYPVGIVLDEMRDLIEQESSVQMGNVGKFSTGIFTPPSDISKNIARERQKKKGNRLLSLWSSIGGNLDANGDGALLAMLSTKFDISPEEATALGKFYRKVRKEENKIRFDRSVWGKDFFPSKTDKDFPDLDIDLAGEEYKKEREKKKKNILTTSRNIVINGVIHAEDILDKDTDRDEILKIIEDPKTSTEQERLDNLSGYLQGRGVDEKKAKIYSQHILVKNAPLWNSGNPKYLRSSEDSLYNALALRIVSDRSKKKSIPPEEIDQEVERVEEELRSFVNNNRSTYGVKLERALLTKRFIESTSNFSKIFLTGEWQKFETNGLGFSQVVKRIEVKDDKGDVVGYYFDTGDSVIGKLLGRSYYLHPLNFFNGTLNNGEFWLKLACGEDGKLNKKSIAYALYNLTPGRLIKRELNSSVRPLNLLAEALRDKVLNPFFGKIMSVTKGLLRKFLGITGIGGFLSSVVLDFLNDKFEAIIIQIVQISLITLLGILCAIFFSFDSITNKSYQQSFLNQNIQPSESNSFTDTDWNELE